MYVSYMRRPSQSMHRLGAWVPPLSASRETLRNPWAWETSAASIAVSAIAAIIRDCNKKETTNLIVHTWNNNNKKQREVTAEWRRWWYQDTHTLHSIIMQRLCAPSPVPPSYPPPPGLQSSLANSMTNRRRRHRVFHSSAATFSVCLEFATFYCENVLCDLFGFMNAPRTLVSGKKAWNTAIYFNNSYIIFGKVHTMVRLYWQSVFGCGGYSSSIRTIILVADCVVFLQPVYPKN